MPKFLIIASIIQPNETTRNTVECECKQHAEQDAYGMAVDLLNRYRDDETLDAAIEAWRQKTKGAKAIGKKLEQFYDEFLDREVGRWCIWSAELIE